MTSEEMQGRILQQIDAMIDEAHASREATEYGSKEYEAASLLWYRLTDLRKYVASLEP